MHLRIWLNTVLVVLVVIAISSESIGSNRCYAQDGDLQALDGVWLYVKDLTEGRTDEEKQPPMTVQFPLRVEDDAVVLVRSRGDERIALDGSKTVVEREGSTATYRGEWKDGTLEYEIEVVRDSDGAVLSLIKREFQPTPEGLLVHVVVGDPAVLDSVALYRHPEDVPLPDPTEASIEAVSWMAGTWIGTSRSSSTEESWISPKGGAMLGTSRTVSGERMVAFEFLRIVERDGGLVYFAQPGGRSATEFVLTEMGDKRAVFENPRHDFPQRIVYEQSDDGALTASIGFINGGKPRAFEFKREED